MTELNLYPYQVDGVKFLTSRRRAILGDEMGLGKTPQSLVAADILDGFPVLIVAPKAAVGVWDAEARKWLGTSKAQICVYLGMNRKLKNTDITITNYSLFEEIVQSRAWRTIVFDEAHKFRNGRVRSQGKRKGVTPQMFASAKKAPKVPNLFFLTGSPIVNDSDDLWPLLHLIDPAKWGSYWTFAKRYMYMENNGYGWTVKGTDPEDPAGTELRAQALRKAIEPYFLRRLKADVLTELPAKRRQPWFLEMEGAQRKAYREMAEESIIQITEDEYLAAPLKIAKITRLRQLLVSPLILDIPDEGAAFRALRELLEDNPHAAVVFTPFTKAIPHLRQYLSGVAKTWEITGKTARSDPLAVKKVADDFNASTEKSKVLIASVQMSTSWAATSASMCYFLGSDWSPAVNKQAEDRLHRWGQQNGVLCRYFTHKGTFDERQQDILDGKTTVEQLIADPRTFLLPDEQAA